MGRGQNLLSYLRESSSSSIEQIVFRLSDSQVLRANPSVNKLCVASSEGWMVPVEFLGRIATLPFEYGATAAVAEVVAMKKTEAIF